MSRFSSGQAPQSVLKAAPAHVVRSDPSQPRDRTAVNVGCGNSFLTPLFASIVVSSDSVPAGSLFVHDFSCSGASGCLIVRHSSCGPQQQSCRRMRLLLRRGPSTAITRPGTLKACQPKTATVTTSRVQVPQRRKVLPPCRLH